MQIRLLQFVTRRQHLRVHRLVDAPHCTACPDDLAVVARHDADQPPAQPLEGLLGVRDLQRRHAVDEPHAERTADTLDRGDRMQAQPGTAVLGRDHGQPAVQRQRLGLAFARDHPGDALAALHHDDDEVARGRVGQQHLAVVEPAAQETARRADAHVRVPAVEVGHQRADVVAPQQLEAVAGRQRRRVEHAVQQRAVDDRRAHNSPPVAAAAGR